LVILSFSPNEQFIIHTLSFQGEENNQIVAAYTYGKRFRFELIFTEVMGVGLR